MNFIFRTSTHCLIKRRTLEAYCLNKHFLLQNLDSQISVCIAFVYIAKTIEDYAKIENP